MKFHIYITVMVCIMLTSCSKSLNETPQGVIQSDDLNTPANIEKLIIAAYSSLGNDDPLKPISDAWPVSSIRSGDAYKGGAGPNDQIDFHAYEVFNLNSVDRFITDWMWGRFYTGIGRVNNALRRLNTMTDAEFPDKAKRQAELRFLRGHFFFRLKVMYKYIPYVDETIPESAYFSISNKVYTNAALWGQIAGDFRFAAENLPRDQAQVGRASKFAAKAYLAKTLLYQAYMQDESNNVISIDHDKLNEVNSLCDEVISTGKYHLSPDFANNFLSQFENNVESVFEIQYSKDDGTSKGRLAYGGAITYPMNQEFGCCGFLQPSRNMINAFKTDNNGLPFLKTFNDVDVAVAENFNGAVTFDPRLDHTVAIPGHPYKYKPDFVYQTSWARVPEIYGNYMGLKQNVLPGDPTFQKVPPFMSSGKNWPVIRYADVLLFKAEALIELNRFNEALPLINEIRQRAANSTAQLKKSNGAFSSNYQIGLYQLNYPALPWNQENAREAMRFERRLEFALEGDRFFDLVRWGIAAEYLNKYFSVEKTRGVTHLNDAQFRKNRDEYLPIPLNQINYSKGLYKQNTGW